MEAPTKAKKEFSDETRAKLSEAMKARWARERVARAARAKEASLASSQTSLLNLYRAAYELTGDDVGLKAAIVDGVTGETLVQALEAETSAGTNLQHKIRRTLTSKIQMALGGDVVALDG
jgi:hypothetical protein